MLQPVSAPPAATTPPVTDAVIAAATRPSPVASSPSSDAASRQRPAALVADSTEEPTSVARAPIRPADQTAPSLHLHSQMSATAPVLTASADVAVTATVPPMMAAAPPAEEQPGARATSPAMLSATPLVSDAIAGGTTEALPDSFLVDTLRMSDDATTVAAVISGATRQHADRIIERAATGWTAGQLEFFGVPVPMASSLPATPSLPVPGNAPAATAPPAVLPPTGTLAGAAEGSGSTGFAAHVGALALLAVSLHTLARLLWMTRRPPTRGYAPLVPPA